MILHLPKSRTRRLAPILVLNAIGVRQTLGQAGGDKLWLLPEGNDDEHHWAGNFHLRDDGSFSFRKLSEGQNCEIELTGLADPQTGVQFVRTIRLDADSPRIHFHASMNAVKVADVDPAEPVSLDAEIASPGKPARLSVHLQEDNGIDRGSLGEVHLDTGETR